MDKAEKAEVVEELKGVFADSGSLVVELRGKLVGLILAPATKIAGIVQAPAGQLARVIGAYSKKEAA